jgi:magnesium-dependent phosphatase 1
MSAVLTSYERAMKALAGKKPSVLVFDCDWTLYPYDCDKHRIAPFKWSSLYGVTDYYGRMSNGFTDVSSIFGAVIDSEIPAAFLSRNPSAAPVKNLLSMLPCLGKGGSVLNFVLDAMPSDNFFHAYSSNGFGAGKDLHFSRLHELTGIPFSEMVFFDDLLENVEAAKAKGITSVKIGKKGLTLEDFEEGLSAWRSREDATEGSAEITPAEGSPAKGAETTAEGS